MITWYLIWPLVNNPCTKLLGPILCVLMWHDWIVFWIVGLLAFSLVPLLIQHNLIGHMWSSRSTKREVHNIDSSTKWSLSVIRWWVRKAFLMTINGILKWFMFDGFIHSILYISCGSHDTSVMSLYGYVDHMIQKTLIARRHQGDTQRVISQRRNQGVKLSHLKRMKR